MGEYGQNSGCVSSLSVLTCRTRNKMSFLNVLLSRGNITSYKIQKMYNIKLILDFYEYH